MMEKIYNGVKEFVFIMLWVISMFIPGAFMILIILLILDLTVIENVEEYYIEKSKSK